MLYENNRYAVPSIIKERVTDNESASDYTETYGETDTYADETIDSSDACRYPLTIALPM